MKVPGKLMLDNDKVKVEEYLSRPQGNVCGKGMHYHDAHLTITLTDAVISVTSSDGKQQEVKIPKETVMWLDAGTHAVINSGDSAARFILVYLKKQPAESHPHDKSITQ